MSQAENKRIESSDVEEREADVLPRAVLQRANVPLATRLRAGLRELTLLGVVRALFLGPLVAYMLVGTALLFVVSEMEALALRLSPWKTLGSFQPTAWHDRGLWLVIAFPMVVPPLLLRAMALLAASVLCEATTLFAKLVRALASGIQSIGRWIFERVANLLRHVFSKIVALLSVVWAWSGILFAAALRGIARWTGQLWGWLSDQLRYIRGLASGIARFARRSTLSLMQWVAAQGRFVVDAARSIRDLAAQGFRSARIIMASLLATVSRIMVAAANAARKWLLGKA